MWQWDEISEIHLILFSRDLFVCFVETKQSFRTQVDGKIFLSWLPIINRSFQLIRPNESIFEVVNLLHNFCSSLLRILKIQQRFTIYTTKKFTDEFFLTSLVDNRKIDVETHELTEGMADRHAKAMKSENLQT